MAEAIAHLDRGLELLAGLPESGSARRESSISRSARRALVAAKGYAAPEVGLAWSRARELCRDVADVSQLVTGPQRTFFFHIVRGELAAALGTAKVLLRLAGQDEDAIVRLIGHRAAGSALVASGRFARGREHLERALAIHDPARHSGLAFHHVFDPRVGSLCLLSFALLALGHPARALDAERRGALRGAAAGAPLLPRPGAVLQRRAPPAARRLGSRLHRADELLSIASEQDFPLWRARAEFLRGWGLTRAGSTAEGLALSRRALADYVATGSGQWLPYLLGVLSEAEGPGAKSLDLLDDGLACVERTGERWFEAELHRHRGEALLAPPTPRTAEAEACFCRALAVARKQGARLWELHAATSLARLWRDQGRRAEARDLLAPVYGWFTEGFDTPDLRRPSAARRAPLLLT